MLLDDSKILFIHFLTNKLSLDITVEHFLFNLPSSLFDDDNGIIQKKCLFNGLRL